MRVLPGGGEKLCSVPACQFEAPSLCPCMDKPEAPPQAMVPPAGDGAPVPDEAATILSHLNAPPPSPRGGGDDQQAQAPGPNRPGGAGTLRSSGGGSFAGVAPVRTSGGAPPGRGVTTPTAGVSPDAMAVMVARLTAARAVETEVEELAGDLRSAPVLSDTSASLGATSPRGDAEAAEDAQARSLADAAVTGSGVLGGGSPGMEAPPAGDLPPPLSADEAALLTRLYEEHRLRQAAADVAGHVGVGGLPMAGGTPRSYLPAAPGQAQHADTGAASRTDAAAVRDSEQRLRATELAAFRAATGQALVRSPSSQELALKARISAAVARVTGPAGGTASTSRVWVSPGGSGEATEATWRSAEHSEPAMASAFTEQRLSAAAAVAEAALKAERAAAAEAAAVSAMAAVEQLSDAMAVASDDLAPHAQQQQPGTPRRTAAPVGRHMPPAAVPRGHANDGAPGSPATPHDAILAIAAAVGGAASGLVLPPADGDVAAATHDDGSHQHHKRFFSQPMPVSELATQVLQLARHEEEGHDGHRSGDAGKASIAVAAPGSGGGGPDVGAAAAVVASTLAGFATTVFNKLVAGAKKGAASRRAAEAAEAAAASSGAAHRDVAEERAAAELSDRLRVVEAWVSQAEQDATYNVAAALRDVSEGLRADNGDGDAAAVVAALAAEVEAVTGGGHAEQLQGAAGTDVSEPQADVDEEEQTAQTAPVLSDEDRRRDALAAAVAAAKARILARATPAADAMFGAADAVASAAPPHSHGGARDTGASAASVLSAAVLAHSTRAALLAPPAAPSESEAGDAAAPSEGYDVGISAAATGDAPAAPGTMTRWEWVQTDDGVWERVLVTWTPGEEPHHHSDGDDVVADEEAGGEQDTPVPDALDVSFDDVEVAAAALPPVRSSRSGAAPRGGEDEEADDAVAYALRRAAAERAAVLEEKRQRAAAAQRAQDAVTAEAAEAAKAAAAALDAAAARDKLVAAVRSEALVRRKALSSAAADRSAHADAMRRRYVAEERRQRDVALNTLATGLCALSSGSGAAALRDMPPTERGAVLLRMRPGAAAAALRAMSGQHRAEALANAQAAARGADVTLALEEGGFVDSQGRAAFNALLEHLTALDAALSGMFEPVAPLSPGGAEEEVEEGRPSLVFGGAGELDTSSRVQQWHSALTSGAGGAASPEAAASPARVSLAAQPISPGGASARGALLAVAVEDSSDQAASGWVEVRPGEWERVC